jgi:hypothetical protein
MSKLTVIPQATLRDNGWEYRITAFGDVMNISYHEDGTAEAFNTFEIPMYCALQVTEKMFELAEEKINLDSEEENAN